MSLESSLKSGIAALEAHPSADTFILRCPCGWWTFEDKRHLTDRIERHFQGPTPKACNIHVHPVVLSELTAEERLIRTSLDKLLGNTNAPR